MYIKQTRQPKLLEDLMKEDFDPATMGPGLKRGMVLNIYLYRIRIVTGTDAFAQDIQDRWLTEYDYEHPTLVIRMRPGSPWKHELHQRRYQIKESINQRLNCNFIKEVRIK